MKITRDDTPTEWAVRAEPGEYDAYPPILRFSVTRHPDAGELHPDRLGLAAYLVFGPYTSGALELPAGISPALARAIELDAAPVPVRPVPVSYAPAKLPIGSRSVSACAGARAESEEGQGGDSGSGIDVSASNGYLIGGDAARRLETELAAALLHAEAWEADELVLDANALAEEERDHVERRLRRLTEPVRLGVVLT